MPAMDGVPDELKPLLEVFRAYNAFGRKKDHDHMDCRTFAKVCRENDLLVKPLLPTDCDLVFSMVIPTPATKQINFNLFVKALNKMVERSDGNLGSTRQVVETLIRNGGPKSSGTVAESTRFHDDKSNYTGMHKNRAGNRDPNAPDNAPVTPQQPGHIQSQQLAGRRAALKAKIDEGLTVDLEHVFETYCNIGKGHTETYRIMDSRSLQHLLKDTHVIGKGFTTVDSDLVFASCLVPGDKTMTFSQFTSCVEKCAARHPKFSTADDLSAHIIAAFKENGGPVLTGTKAEYTKWHDDKATYTGMHAEVHDAFEEKLQVANGERPEGSPAPSKTNSGGGWGKVRTASEKAGMLKKRDSSKRDSFRSLVRTASFLARQEAASKPVPEKYMPLRQVFEKYNSFGAKKNPNMMDGRTFAKLCRDMHLLKKPLLPTDCDLVFAEVLTVPGQKQIDFKEFVYACERLVKRANGQLGDMDTAVTHILTTFEAQGGPSSNGTVAEPNKFHDDKSLYTGVYKNGGPTNVDLGTSDLKYITNRAAADVRGVQS